MPPIRTRPAPNGILAGAPISLFYVTSERRRQVPRMEPPADFEIDLRGEVQPGPGDLLDRFPSSPID